MEQEDIKRKKEEQKVKVREDLARQMEEKQREKKNDKLFDMQYFD